MTSTLAASEVRQPDQTRQDGTSRVGKRDGSSRTVPLPHLGGQAVPALVLALVLGTIIGSRVVVRGWHQDKVSPVSVGQPAAPVPISAALEATWGLRFTNVIVVADNGGVELRYQVLDEGKAAKIHQGTGTNNQLPTLQAEGSRAKITPSSVLMHFHHGDPKAGRSYSIVYGNAGGAVKSGAFITLVMKDGLKIKHIQVSD